MKLTEQSESILQEIDAKYQRLHLKTETQLEGLLWAKPITYWDYIQTDALLNLQIQRTTLPDEMVFILYHQINELIFKMILGEMHQLSFASHLNLVFFKDKIGRINRYFDMLTSSFAIMENGMDVEQYMKFRTTLSPASGFQSAQYRLIEFCATDSIQLIDARFREKCKSSNFDEMYEYLYWQAAGKDYSTGNKSYLLQEFERKYKPMFLNCMKDFQNCNLWQRFKQLSIEEQSNADLIQQMRHLDYTINIKWVMQHLQVAIKYIEHSGLGDGEATGGSDWKKYMHPQYQRRIFFPELWTSDELTHWGKEHQI